VAARTPLACKRWVTDAEGLPQRACGRHPPAITSPQTRARAQRTGSDAHLPRHHTHMQAGAETRAYPPTFGPLPRSNRDDLVLLVTTSALTREPCSRDRGKKRTPPVLIRALRNTSVGRLLQVYCTAHCHVMMRHTWKLGRKSVDRIIFKSMP